MMKKIPVCLDLFSQEKREILSNEIKKDKENKDYQFVLYASDTPDIDSQQRGMKEFNKLLSTLNLSKLVVTVDSSINLALIAKPMREELLIQSSNAGVDTTLEYYDGFLTPELLSEFTDYEFNQLQIVLDKHFSLVGGAHVDFRDKLAESPFIKLSVRTPQDKQLIQDFISTHKAMDKLFQPAHKSIKDTDEKLDRIMRFFDAGLGASFNGKRGPDVSDEEPENGGPSTKR